MRAAPYFPPTDTLDAARVTDVIVNDVVPAAR
jgi:hypothetical protein